MSFLFSASPVSKQTPTPHAGSHAMSSPGRSHVVRVALRFMKPAPASAGALAAPTLVVATGMALVFVVAVALAR